MIFISVPNHRPSYACQVLLSVSRTLTYHPNSCYRCYFSGSQRTLPLSRPGAAWTGPSLPPPGVMVKGKQSITSELGVVLGKTSWTSHSPPCVKRRRRLRWLGHVLRMPNNSLARVALGWTPQGRCKRDRPKIK